MLLKALSDFNMEMFLSVKTHNKYRKIFKRVKKGLEKEKFIKEMKKRNNNKILLLKHRLES